MKNGGGGFLSVSLSISGNDGFVEDSDGLMEDKGFDEKEVGLEKNEEKEKVIFQGTGAMNTTKHLLSGAVSAAVSRFALYDF